MPEHEQSERRLIFEADEKYGRLQSLRRLFVGQLAFLGAFLWVAALSPATFAHLQAIVVRVFAVAAAASLVVIVCELLARRRFRQLIDVGERAADDD